ncbi:hypothetical protein B0H19DRAFT_1082038 [Mycena capillaripes]|nr:hypothetical protein B0H19DRAFT_1082038 [Mycena capillaripes]
MDARPLVGFEPKIRRRWTAISIRWFSSFVQSSSLGTRGISRDTSADQNSDMQESDTLEYSPATTRPYHPSDAVNKHLLGSVSSEGSKLGDVVLVAVTHDEEWVSALNEYFSLKDEENVPAESELIRRICDNHTVETTSGNH